MEYLLLFIPDSFVFPILACTRHDKST